MAEFLRKQPPHEAVLLAWPLLCGREVASRSQAVSLSDGTLTVEVADAEWRNQLQSFAPRYLSGYQELLGPQVQQIEFKVKQSAIRTEQPAISNHSARPVRSASASTASAAKKRSPSRNTKKG
jgi:hypothetical protein